MPALFLKARASKSVHSIDPGIRSEIGGVVKPAHYLVLTMVDVPPRSRATEMEPVELGTKAAVRLIAEVLPSMWWPVPTPAWLAGPTLVFN